MFKNPWQRLMLILLLLVAINSFTAISDVSLKKSVIKEDLVKGMEYARDHKYHTAEHTNHLLIQYKDLLAVPGVRIPSAAGQKKFYISILPYLLAAADTLNVLPGLIIAQTLVEGTSRDNTGASGLFKTSFNPGMMKHSTIFERSIGPVQAFDDCEVNKKAVKCNFAKFRNVSDGFYQMINHMLTSKYYVDAARMNKNYLEFLQRNIDSPKQAAQNYRVFTDAYYQGLKRWATGKNYAAKLDAKYQEMGLFHLDYAFALFKSKRPKVVYTPTVKEQATPEHKFVKELTPEEKLRAAKDAFKKEQERSLNKLLKSLQDLG